MAEDLKLLPVQDYVKGVGCVEEVLVEIHLDSAVLRLH